MTKTVTITMAGVKGKKTFSGKTIEIIFEKINKHFSFMTEWGIEGGRLIGTCQDVRYYISIPNVENIKL